MGSIVPCLVGSRELVAMLAPSAPPRSRTFRSRYLKKTFAEYPWDSDRWVCESCRATWNIKFVDWEDVHNGMASIHDKQIAVHGGNQTVEWTYGDSGMCERCDVLWIEE